MKKEWQKFKLYLFVLSFVCVGTLFFFWYHLDYLFTTLEPESMMWYKFSQFQDKPYYEFIYLFLSIGFVISFAQFLPEKIKDRIKIMIHLPKKISTILFSHLIIGTLFVFLISFVVSAILVFIIYNYYPDVILSIVVKDMFFYTIASVIIYLFSSAVILEKNPLVAFLKFILGLFFLFLFVKNEFTTSDIIWLVLLGFIPFLALDSLRSMKQQRLQSKLFYGVIIFVVLLIGFKTYKAYEKKYQKDFSKYYIFYSNSVNDFVYQKNYGDHNFEYGIKEKKTFDQYEYESYLPFVYWKNLDIQKKLPVIIAQKIYTKEQIKNSRLSFNYHPRYLKKQELQLYPFFNPLKDKGMIPFPEEMFSPTKNKFVVYNYDDGVSKELTKQINETLVKNNVMFPIQNVWGKATNMKPFDQGYIIEDMNNNLFNLKRADNKITVRKIEYPKGIKIRYIRISENKQKNLTGYAIDTKNGFYILTWDFKFIKLDLPEFKYEKMRLKIISNPINYLIRFSDDKNYYGVVYDKKFQKIKEIHFDK